jgi:hypothetical protein
MASGVSSPIAARALVGEARFALKAYAVVGLVGIIVTFGAARLGHPLFSFIDIPTEAQAPKPQPIPAAPAPAQSDSAIPIAKLFLSEPDKFQKVTPNNPGIVVGTAMFDSNHSFVGRVIGVHTAPVTTLEGTALHKEERLFVTVESSDGAAQLIDYGVIEWRAISSAKPDVGVITTSLKRNGTPANSVPQSPTPAAPWPTTPLPIAPMPTAPMIK